MYSNFSWISIRVQLDLRAIGFVKRNALIYSILAAPAWLLKRPHINYNIHRSFKDNTSPEIYRNKFFEFCDHYKDLSQLYTDGSKMGNEAVVHGNVTKTTRLPNKASIFRAELHAISLALSLIRRSKEKNYTHLANTGKTIFCWIPSHVNIRGNETLQQNQLCLCLLQIWSFQHVNLYRVFPSSV